jgi:choline dehydrogenase-like flavoprotein
VYPADGQSNRFTTSRLAWLSFELSTILMTKENAKLETPDVCVVGAGPAGLTTALALGAAGRNVVLIESGGFRSSGAVQELNDGDLEGEAYAGLGCTRHRQIGGTVNIWDVSVRNRRAAKYVPLSARDMADWPIGWNDLEPYYVEAQKVCGLGPFEYGAEYWTTTEHRPFQLGGTGLTSGVYQFGYADRFTRELVDRLRRTEAITLVPSATVTGLTVNRGARRVRDVRAVDDNGRILEVKARTIILACGAVENARLLLLGGIGDGSGSKWLGQGFMEHARDFSLVLVPESPELFAEASFYDLHTSKGGFLVGGRVTLTDDAMNRFQLPNASMTLVPRTRAHSGRQLADRFRRLFHHTIGVRSDRRYGWSRVRSPASAFDAFRIILNIEQQSQPWNRIELSDRRDRFGNPLPRLVLRWTDQEQELLEQLRVLLGEWFRGANLGRLLTIKGQRPDLNAHHHAGTSRMARTREDGVVDPDGLVFGCENLYVAGASVFPSAGFANPMLTIVALALRLARHIDASLG